MALIPAFLVAALLADPFHLSFGGNAETAVVSNGHRKSGGGEFSVGDFLLRLRFDAEKGPASVYADWVPEESVLHYRNRPNPHNEHWLRADGYVSRPFLLAGALLEWRDFRLLAGGFRASGLEPLRPPSRYYLVVPAPLLHTEHYDKGFLLAWKRGPFSIEGAVIDGDWAVGESNVFQLSNSAQNSYPSYAAGMKLDLRAVHAGITGTFGDLGSHPGEKRRQNDAVAWAGVRLPPFEARAFLAYAERNPAGDGNGKNSPPVRTIGPGIEAFLRVESVDLYANAWHLRNIDGRPDGEIWIDGSRETWGAGGGARWNSPLRLPGAYVGAFGGIVAGEPLFVADIGIDF